MSIYRQLQEMLDELYGDMQCYEFDGEQIPTELREIERRLLSQIDEIRHQEILEHPL